MATAIAIASDQTLNLSTIGGSSGALRAPYATSSAPSMADTLPSLSNFGFDDLRSHMARFTTRFDEFIERGRMRVLEERNHFRMSVAEIDDQEQNTSRALQALRQKTTAHTSQLSSQQSETSEMHVAIASLTQTRDMHADNADQLKNKVMVARNAIAGRKESVRERQEHLAYQAGFNASELRFWEERLGLKVDGAEREDRVRFDFAFDDGRREAWFELDMSNGFQVVGARPSLERYRERVDDCIRQMGMNEDLGAFLKGIREIIVEIVM